MDKLGINYDVVDLATNPDVLESFKAQGYTQAPIVTTDVKIWSGFRNEKIESLSRHLKLEDRQNERK